MKKMSAFTLLEVLISLSLSSFILLALTQSYRTATKFFERSRERMIDNRKICLLFNQFERDISAAFIPTLYKEIIPETEKQNQKVDTEQTLDKALTKEEKKEQKKKELEKLKDFFLGTEHDEFEQTFKFEERRLKPSERLTFITTNPLQVYGNSRAHFVRVAYELVKDKQHSNKEHASYKLIRKESYDIENVTMKVNQFDYEKLAKQDIREQVIADKVKSIHFEFISFKEAETSDNSDDQETTKKKTNEDKQKEEFRSFTWGDKPYTQGVVPQRVEVTVVFWNEDFLGTHYFHTMIPIYSYPTEQSEEVKKSLVDQIQANQPTTQGSGTAQTDMKLTGAKGAVAQQGASAAQPIGASV